jgi:predicted double-glycine peptidase
LLDIPHVLQTKNYSCGPASMRAVMAYYGSKLTEDWLIKAMHCTPDDGTSPASMSRFVRSWRHRIKTSTNLTLTDLHEMTANGWPVIVAYQDWPHRPSETDLTRTYDNGHYAVVCGIEDDKVYLMDPSSSRRRKTIEAPQFVARWRDIGVKGEIYSQWGLAIGPLYSRRS